MKRAQTVIVTMPDDKRFAIPAEFVANHRATYFARRITDASSATEVEVFKSEVAYALRNPEELTDWMDNNMDWSNVEKVAKELPPRFTELVDYNQAWSNADKDVVLEEEETT